MNDVYCFRQLLTFIAPFSLQLQASSTQSVLKHITLYRLNKQVMRKNEKEGSDEIGKMMRICEEGRTDKRTRQVVTWLLKRMKQIQQNKSKQDLTVFICLSQRQKHCDDQSFIMACLIYLFVKFRALKVSFQIKTSIPKPKKQDLHIKICVSQLNLQLSKNFYEKISTLLEESEVRQASTHFEQLKFKCQSQIIDFQPPEVKQLLFKLREDTYYFIYQFYDHVSEIFQNKKVFIALNHIHFFTQKENTIALQNSEMLLYGQELYTKKILSKISSFFINILVIKAQSSGLVQDFMCKEEQEQQQQQQEQSEQASQQDHEYHQYQQNLGYFAKFYGNPFEFLSKLLLIFPSPPDFNHIQKILPRIPNISSLKIHKEDHELVLFEIDELVQTIMTHNKLLEIFWLQKIRVQNIQSKLLQALYEECPYLYQFQINIPFRHFIQQTYAFTSPEDKQIKENERECQIILNTLRLRRISLSHNIEMSKMLINQKYKFNQIIEIIDCIQPVCF